MITIILPSIRFMVLEGGSIKPIMGYTTKLELESGRMQGSAYSVCLLPGTFTCTCMCLVMESKQCVVTKIIAIL